MKSFLHVKANRLNIKVQYLSAINSVVFKFKFRSSIAYKIKIFMAVFCFHTLTAITPLDVYSLT